MKRFTFYTFLVSLHKLAAEAGPGAQEWAIIMPENMSLPACSKTQGGNMLEASHFQQSGVDASSLVNYLINYSCTEFFDYLLN